MSDIESGDLQNSATAGLALQNDQPAERNVLLPFEGDLWVDVELRLSQENFKQTIYDIFKHKDTTPLSQLSATPPFPTPYVLAQFAYKTYTDYKQRETDAQYETRLALPDGWKLLTTASNSSKTNGYFGAAYWHPEHQQVVIAHRGTKLTNLGALWTDLVGVVFKNHAPEMCSATTFANKVVEVLQEVSRMKEFGFQLFFTGHSLGGWLAQVTTFTTKYLTRTQSWFLKSNNDQDCYHPHTVVFESPGCENMLLKMTDKFDVRHYGRSTDLKHLDITSYLSAPNLINTCNKHIGTVYRIFTDLSDMGWMEKHTPLYNRATHNLKKIVQAFNPETGQVCRDEEGQLKVKVVVDWPIGPGILGAEEFMSFFEWAEHLNKYDPHPVNYMSYNQIHYQTKIYDERVNSFSIFSEEEQEFLECYCWLRQLPEFFKSKEMFSVLENNQAQEEAEKLLKSFEIENNTVRCTDASALQALIPYVKRLLQLFPEIKDKAKLALSSDEVRKKVYQIETERYVERINQSSLEFNSDSFSFRGFLENEKQNVLHLQMHKGDEWTGLIKVHQDLQKNGRFSEGQYIVLNIERLLTVNQMMDIGELMQSTVTPYLLLIACEDNQQLDGETKDVITKLFDKIKQKPNIKIIFITRLGGSIFQFLHTKGRELSENGFVRRVEQLTWTDLTTSSKEKLLQKSVKFQGAKISLKQLIFAESPVAKFLPFDALLEERELQIADPLPVSNGYNEGYYIGRIFRHHKVIKQGIYSEEEVKEKRIFLAGTEEKFKQLCQLHPNSIVHWVEKDKGGKLLWQQSQGSLKTVRKYIDSDSSDTYTDGDLVKLLEQAEHQRVMLISDIAGMGKSTVLTHLAKQIKQNSPAKWVVRIDLNDHTDMLKILKQGQINSKEAIEFVSEKLLKLKPGLEMELFKQCCEKKQKVRIVIMLDGFDEVSPSYKETVFGLLQALRQTEVEQLWVTTRPHLRDELEDKLQQLSFTLQPFSEENQVEFLTQFWRLKDWFIDPEEKAKEIQKNKLEIYAEHLIKKLANSISDKDKKFTGIPLQTRMLAEAFDGEVKIFYLSSEPMRDLPLKLDLLELYGRFIERKYDIYQEEKGKMKVNIEVARELRERDLKIIRQEYQLLAMKVLFTEEQVALLQNNNQCIFSVEELARIGLVQLSHEGKPHFIHRTFAEYYVANWFVNNNSQKVQDFILKDIFLKEEYQVIRVFIDGLLSRSKPSKEMSIQYGTRIDDLGNDCLLHTAALEGNANIIEFILESARAAGHKDKVIGLLLGQDEGKRTAWSLAAASGELEVLEIISVWAKENLKREEIRKQMFLATDSNGNTVWHLAAKGGNQDVLQKICDLAKDYLTAEEIKNKLFLATDRYGQTAWYLAAKERNQDILLKICDLAKDYLTREELKNVFFLFTDSDRNTAWHLVALWGNQDVVQKVFDLAKEYLTAEEIKDMLFLATDTNEKTAWHLAVVGHNEDALQKICDLAKDYLTAEEIKNILFLDTDSNGNTAWHFAAVWDNQDVLQKILDFAKDYLTAEEIKNSLCLATDSDGYTAWHLNGFMGIQYVKQKLWDFVKDNLTAEQIKNMFFVATDIDLNTVWHLAAMEDNEDILQKLWDFAKDNLTAEEIKNILILSTDKDGSTAWHLAAEDGNQDLLQKLWNFVKENLTAEEIKNMLCLATDRDGNTAWHLAVLRGNQDVLQKICDFTKDNLTAEDIKIMFLISTDRYGNTAWHLAALRGNQDLLQKICDFAKDNLTSEEIKNMMFFATDSDGNTAWYLAVRRGNQDALQKICDFAKDNLTAEEIQNMILISTDRYGNTAWHWAALRGNQDVLQKICDFAKVYLTAEEIKNMFFLTTDSNGNTAWDLAVRRGNQDILQKICDLANDYLTAEEINKYIVFSHRVVWDYIEIPPGNWQQRGGRVNKTFKRKKL